MKITLAEGMHYCHDCGNLVIDNDHDSVWYCPTHAKFRGWNIIDGKRIKVCCLNGQSMERFKSGNWYCHNCDITLSSDTDDCIKEMEKQKLSCKI